MNRWAECRVETDPEAVEAITALFIDLGAGGTVLEERDTTAVVSAYFPDDPGLPAKLEQLRRELASLPRYGLRPGPARLDVKWVQEEDWAHGWKVHFRPRPVGRRLLVHPSWEPLPTRDALNGRLPIVIDPGMAFGTGSHPTTRLCLELLEVELQPGDRCADIGTGSGILAIAAARLGAAVVVAVDIDGIAVATARANVERNGVLDRVAVLPGSVEVAQDRLGGPVNVVVANLTAEVLAATAGGLAALTAPEGKLIVGGIVTGKIPLVTAAFADVGLAARYWRREGEWASAVLGRV